MAVEAVHECQCGNCQQADEHPDKELHAQMNLFLSRLDEQQRRWYVGLEAKKLGHGGITRLSEITGLDVSTIRRGQEELDQDLATRPTDRIRLPGGGRPAVEKKSGLEAALEQLVEEDTGGDPMSEKKWVRRSLQQLSQALGERGYPLSRMTLRRLLKKRDYSLHANVKRLTGAPHPDRNRQFRYLARVKKLFLAAGYPVLSTDTQHKELIGNFKNPGRVWSRQGEALGQAVPYGIYDLQHNLGSVYIGQSADTAEFAVEAIVRWWQDPDRPHFAREDRLLLLCDAGGSNGYRSRLWKQQLQERLADPLGVEVMVCHYPTGASKWNPIEHRLFSYISLNWAGKPLRTFETLLGYIRDTTTTTGLKVKAFLMDRVYQTGIRVSDEAMAALNLVRRRICPQWNYILKPRSASP